MDPYRAAEQQTQFRELNVSVIVLNFDLSSEDNWLHSVKRGQE